MRWNEGNEIACARITILVARITITITYHNHNHYNYLPRRTTAQLREGVECGAAAPGFARGGHLPEVRVYGIPRPLDPELQVGVAFSHEHLRDFGRDLRLLLHARQHVLPTVEVDEGLGGTSAEPVGSHRCSIEAMRAIERRDFFSRSADSIA